jgi:hypothetical protein
MNNYSCLLVLLASSMIEQNVILWTHTRSSVDPSTTDLNGATHFKSEINASSRIESE